MAVRAAVFAAINVAINGSSLSDRGMATHKHAKVSAACGLLVVVAVLRMDLMLSCRLSMIIHVVFFHGMSRLP